MWVCPRCKRRNAGAVCDCGYHKHIIGWNFEKDEERIVELEKRVSKIEGRVNRIEKKTSQFDDDLNVVKR